MCVCVGGRGGGGWSKDHRLINLYYHASEGIPGLSLLGGLNIITTYRVSMQEIDSFVCYHKLKGILPSVPDQEFEL